LKREAIFTLKLVFFKASESRGKKQNSPQPTKNLLNTVTEAKYLSKHSEA